MLQSQGMRVEEAARLQAIAPQTYFRQRKEYGDMNTAQARKLIDQGDAYVSRSKPGDQEMAQETFQQSLDMFTEMCAPGYFKVLEEQLRNMYPPFSAIRTPAHLPPGFL